MTVGDSCTCGLLDECNDRRKLQRPRGWRP
jgi:hypothetical protein